MVVILVAWCLLTLLQQGGQLPPPPIPSQLHFSKDALGWLDGGFWPRLTAIAVVVGFGHSILAVSGEESLAQVYREIERPKVRNLQRAGMVIFLYSLFFMGLVSFFAVIIIPDDVRPRFFDNLISGLARNLVGPLPLRLLFQALVVIVGFLILAGAANTAIVGSNGGLNRVSGDGVLTDWFRKPHPRFGTTYRLINLVVMLQLLTIVLSRGDVYLLGEAYAFGVVWSFAFNALAVLILRYKQPHAPREWRVPLNARIGGTEVPFGLIGIAVVLFSCAVVNLFTKEVATMAGVAFTGAFFVMFVVSERIVTRWRAGARGSLDQFQLTSEQEIPPDALGCRPGSVLVPVRDYNTLTHLDWVLGQPEAEGRDVVVLMVRLLSHGHGATGLGQDQIFSDYEQTLFTRVVAIAERHGRTVMLLVAPGSNVFDALAQAARQLRAGMIVVGESEVMSPDTQSHLLGEAWDRLGQDAAASTRFVVLGKTGQVRRFPLGAHASDLSPADIDRIHEMRIVAVKDVGPSIHPRDVVAAALDEFERALHGEGRQDALERLRRRSASPP